MEGWRNWKIGDQVLFSPDDGDIFKTTKVSPVTYTGMIVSVENDHLIARIEGMNCWIDDDTAYQFSREVST